MPDTPLLVKVSEVTISKNSARRLDAWCVGVGRANPMGELRDAGEFTGYFLVLARRYYRQLRDN